MTETEQRRHIRGITVYNRITDDVAQRCLPLSSQPSNSAEFLLHTAAQRMSNNKSVTQQLIVRQTCIFQTHHHRSLTADPWPTSDFFDGDEMHWAGSTLVRGRCPVFSQYFRHFLAYRAENLTQNICAI